MCVYSGVCVSEWTLECVRKMGAEIPNACNARVCACVCACVCVCVRACVRVCMSVRTCLHACVRACVSACACVRARVCVFVIDIV